MLFLDRSKMNRLMTSYPYLEPRSPAPTPLEDPPQDIPPRHSTRVRSIPAYLLNYHCYTTLATLHKPHTYHEAFTNLLGQIAMKEELDALTKPLSNPSLYRRLVGSLVCLTVTHPDISYAVHQVSQYLSAPRSTHYAAVLCILRYLKGTLFHGLFYSA